MKVYQKLASTLQAYVNCINHGNEEWENKHAETVALLMRDAPRGSGFDAGTSFDIDGNLVENKKGEADTREYLRFQTAFHHMDEHGSYCGWSYHTVTIRPDFVFGFRMSVGGENKRDIKDYIAQTFYSWLESEVDEAAVKIKAEAHNAMHAILMAGKQDVWDIACSNHVKTDSEKKS